MAKVYVAEVEGEAYDRPSYVCTAATVKAAEAEIKRRFGKPYEVTWGEKAEKVVDGEKRWVLVGEFAKVMHYSIEHTATFTIRSQEVVK